jgi:acyl carrier protein
VSLPEAAAATKQDAFLALRAVMESELGLSPEQIQPGAHLVDDLDLDSIDLVDLSVSLEEAMGLVLGKEELESILTVQDAVDVIHAGLLGRGSDSA